MAMPAWIAEAGIAAQVVIATAAIFGERIRALLGPQLRVQLVNVNGRHHALAVTLPGPTPDTTSVQIISSRYYHVRVTNRTAHPEAREVEVLLTQLDIQGPDGNPQTVFSGAIPLNWQHYDIRSRTIGRATVANADLFAVHAGFNDGQPTLFFTPKVQPIDFPAQMIGAQHFWLTLIARGLNGESNPLRLRVDWDGGWDRGDAEMAKRLIVTVQR
jgi:hypothetical protein